MVERIASPAPLAWAITLAACLLLALSGIISCAPRQDDFLQNATYEPSAGKKDRDRVPPIDP